MKHQRQILKRLYCILFILLAGCSLADMPIDKSNDSDTKCESISYLMRCENNEVVCYSTRYSGGGMDCKWKKTPAKGE